MASHDIEITRTAEKQLKGLPREEQRRVARAIVALADQPRPRGSRKLSGYDDVFRIRVGRYRVLYSISDRKLIIIILKLGHRRKIYRH
jgi:mRNA interferase RelE/StbE